MKPFTWAVVQDCRLVGYVRAYSEWDAMRMAEKKYGSRLFVERVYLNDPIPEGKDSLTRSEV